jgi:nucleotide-binding universal stress UspA family protein
VGDAAVTHERETSTGFPQHAVDQRPIASVPRAWIVANCVVLVFEYFNRGTAVTKFSRILCAVDFSEPAGAALRQALALSRAHDAELAIVIAVPANEPRSMRVRKRTAEIAALRRASDAVGVRMTVSVQHGDPAPVILHHATSRRCDLIVLGTHNRTGFERFRSGSVAEQVTRRAACPVLVVPLSADGSHHHTTRFFRNVLCPIDFSEVSTAALEQALGVVDQTTGRLTLVHVLPSLNPMSRHAHHVGGPDYGPLLKRDAWQRLQECVPSELRGATNLRARVVSGPPAEQIARVSREIGADLIVMGVTARGAIGRRLLGSTAARVMRLAGRPMLAIPERLHKTAMVNSKSDVATTVAA